MIKTGARLFYAYHAPADFINLQAKSKVIM